jgi:hypothetical protein
MVTGRSPRRSGPRLRAARALLGAVGEGVLVGAADLEVLRDVLGGLGHASMPTAAFMRGLTKRQPMVVS